MRDAEHVDHLFEVGAALAGRREPRAIVQILADIQMRKQARLLEDIADAAFVARNKNVSRSIEQNATVDDDAALVWRDHPGDDVDHRRLSRPRGAEQGRQPTRRREADLERKLLDPVADGNFNSHSISSRRPTRFAKISETSSAPIEIMIEIKVSRNAPASPPGTCVKV